MSSRYRAAHYGTGHAGTLALRQLLQRPDLQLLGHLVHTRERVGRDSGEIVGVDPVGVRATGDFEAFCELNADCVTYMATEFGRDVDEVVDEMCRLLESGKNVVTTTFIRLVCLRSLPPEMLTKLEKACAAGQSAFIGTGIAPDSPPMPCRSTSGRSRRSRVAFRWPNASCSGTYSDPLSFQALGFGTAPQGQTSDLPADVWTAHFGGAVQMLADGYGWELQMINAFRDVALADRDYQFAAGAIPRGTVAALRMRFDGVVDGEPRLRMSWIDTMPDDPGDSWTPERPEGSHRRRIARIDIDGTPNVSLTLELDGGELPGVDATAARALNAVAAVSSATPNRAQRLGPRDHPPGGQAPITSNGSAVTGAPAMATAALTIRCRAVGTRTQPGFRRSTNTLVEGKEQTWATE